MLVLRTYGLAKVVPKDQIGNATAGSTAAVPTATTTSSSYKYMSSRAINNL